MAEYHFRTMGTLALNFGFEKSKINHAIVFVRAYKQVATGGGLTAKDKGAGKLSFLGRANLAAYAGWADGNKTIRGSEIAGD